jgi:probable addiction module antidote protein
MAAIAEKTHLSRETLYRTLSTRGNPTIKTLSAVLKATGLKLGVSAN